MTTKTENNNVSAPNIIEAFFKAYKNYFNFKDRTSRYDFWGFLVTYFLASLILGIIAAFLTPISILGTIFSFATIIPFIAIIVRRLHDRNKSALTWFALPFLAAIVLAIASSAIFAYSNNKNGLILTSFIMVIAGLYYFTLLIMCAFKGQAESNRFGSPVTETPRQVKVGKWLAIFYFVIPIFGVLSVGAISGYSRAMAQYDANKAFDQAMTVSANIRALYPNGSYDGLNNQIAINQRIVPLEMLSVNPGQLIGPRNTDVQISGSGNTYTIRYQKIPLTVCRNIQETPFYDTALSVKVEETLHGMKCTEKCLPEDCTVTFTSK